MGLEIKFDLEGLDETTERVHDAATIGLLRAAEHIKSRAQEKAPIETHKLQGSIDVRPRGRDGADVFVPVGSASGDLVPPEPGVAPETFGDIADRWRDDPLGALNDPLESVLAFLGGLEDHRQADLLQRLVTPESQAGWGDFSAAARLLADIAPSAVQAFPSRPAEDVAYAHLVTLPEADAGASFDPGRAPVAAVITLVWRPEAVRWLVHAFRPYLRTEELPPTARGEAP